MTRKALMVFTPDKRATTKIYIDIDMGIDIDRYTHTCINQIQMLEIR